MQMMIELNLRCLAVKLFGDISSEKDVWILLYLITHVKIKGSETK